MCFPNKHARVPVCGYGLVILGELGIVPLSEKTFLISFSCPRQVVPIFHTVPDRHSSFFRPVRDLSSSHSLRKLRRGSASMLFWVKFVYTAGVSLSCNMVVKRGPPEGLSLMNTHSSKNAFFKASSIGIHFTNMLILVVAFPFSGAIKCWHHCRQVFTSCSASQSRPLPFFPPGCTFSVATTVACCPCHLVRVTSTFAVGKVAQVARR